MYHKGVLFSRPFPDDKLDISLNFYIQTKYLYSPLSPLSPFKDKIQMGYSL